MTDLEVLSHVEDICDALFPDTEVEVIVRRTTFDGDRDRSLVAVLLMQDGGQGLFSGEPGDSYQKALLNLGNTAAQRIQAAVEATKAWKIISQDISG